MEVNREEQPIVIDMILFILNIVVYIYDDNYDDNNYNDSAMIMIMIVIMIKIVKNAKQMTVVYYIWW